MGGVLVVEPRGRVVAVRQAEAGHPVLPLGVATSFGHEARYKGRGADVKLQPLVSCNGSDSVTVTAQLWRDARCDDSTIQAVVHANTVHAQQRCDTCYTNTDGVMVDPKPLFLN